MNDEWVLDQTKQENKINEVEQYSSDDLGGMSDELVSTRLRMGWKLTVKNNHTQNC